MASFFMIRSSASTFSSSIFLSFVLLSFGALSRAQSTVPGMYVFGDSLVDVGNNNYLELSIIKADFPYNGIDYPGGQATGRFSNGKNAADFLAEKVGLASAPPYLGQPDGVFVKGVSFASGGAGIFNTTDESLIKHTIPLAHQLGHFNTVRQRLAKELGSNLQEHLSKSLFPIVIGSNDIINYFKTGSDASQKYSPQQYVTLMVPTSKNCSRFTQIYSHWIALIGCAPKVRYSSPTGECNKDVNYWAKKYNDELTQMLHELKSELKEFQYSYFDTYGVFTEFIQSPATYGFNDTKSACCGLGKLRAKFPCTPLALFCSDRSGHLFWDVYHPTEAAARIFIDMLWRGSGNYTFPMTVEELIAI
ncbi:UNVERIFIED_CONTAM: GDSL esterase/lipase [Sesamum latifolium]|uniref:GDSL esterase/lipase n=1 Tax=Sesamum latifolium TaxID=2727402 RepID=A0AAW2WPM3_9LAMI